MSRDILDRDWVLYREAMALTLHPCLVDEHASIGGETYDWKSITTSRLPRVHRLRPSPELTGKGETNVIVEHDDLSYRSWVLQLEDGLLFDTQDHHVLPAHTHLN